MRQRRILSCLNCYKRKVKCDKKKPVCSACEINRVPSHLCVYNQSPLALHALNEKQMRNEILSLRTQIELLKGGNSSDITSAELFDLSEFGGFKKGVESAKFNGASSSNAIFYKSLGNLKMIGQLIHGARDSYYTLVPMNRTDISPNTSITSCLERIPQLVPSFKEMSTSLTEYLQNPNTLSCINETKLFQYFSSVFDNSRVDIHGHVKMREGVGLVRIVLVLSILLENSILKKDSKYAEHQELFNIVKYLLLNAELGVNFATLYALIFTYQLEKYEFNGDLSKNYRNLDLLSVTIRFATMMGLQNDIDMQFKDEPLDFRNALRNAWSFLVVEDAINSIQKGSPPLIPDAYFEERLIFEDDINSRDMVILFREIGFHVNLKDLHHRVDLNLYIDRLEMLSQQGQSRIDIFERSDIIRLCFIQTLAHLRFLAAPTDYNKVFAARQSLILYRETQKLVQEIETTNSKYFSPKSEFHDVKIALFRCLYLFVQLFVNHDSSNMYYDEATRLVVDREYLITFLKSDVLKCVDVVGKFNMRSLLLKSFLFDLIDRLTNNRLGSPEVPSSHPFSLEGFVDVEELESVFFS